MVIRKASHSGTASFSTGKVQRYVRFLDCHEAAGISYQLDGIRAAVIEGGAPELVVVVICCCQQQSFENKQTKKYTHTASQKQPKAGLDPPQNPSQDAGPAGGGGDGDTEGEPPRHCPSQHKQGIEICRLSPLS